MTKDSAENSVSERAKPDNPVVNILCNIIIPIVILNKLSGQIGSLKSLFLALAFPLGYGIYDFVKKKKLNFVSILGLLNVAFTGGLAVLGLSGMWFAVKEAAFPSLVGLFVLFSSFGKKPFIKTLFFNPQVMKIKTLEESLDQRQTHGEFENLMRITTRLLAISFALSAVLNFTLALHIFTPISEGLGSEQMGIILNEQIAQMTKWSMAVILLPSILFLMGIFYFLMKGLTRITGLKMEELLH